MSFALPSGKTFIIAEAGINHNGDATLARRMIDVAIESGADAVKFQMFDVDELLSPSAPLADYQQKSGEENQYEMLRRTQLSTETFRELHAYAQEKGILFIVTPFDAASAHFLFDLPVPAIKIPSGEITNIPFLKEVAAMHRYTIISTGMCDMDEVRTATDIFHNAGTDFALLHCVSSYPAPFEQINLCAMDLMREEFGVPVGYSDHTQGIEVALAAVARGAAIIEKHFTLDRTLPGPDHSASLEPAELAAMVRGIRIIEQAVGKKEKQCQPCEQDVRNMARRSVALKHAVSAGTTLTENMLTTKRPGTGIAPANLASVIGRITQHDLHADIPLTDSDLS